MKILKSKKIFFIVLLAIISILGLIYFNVFAKNYFTKSEEILSRFKELESLESDLDIEIIKSNFFLYYDYDNIYRKINEIRKNLDYLENTKHLKGKNHKGSYKYLKKYETYLNKKEKEVIKFETINSMMKNSIIYIPGLIFRYINNTDTNPLYYDYNIQLTKILSALFLLKNSFDEDFLSLLKESIRSLEESVYPPNMEKFHKVLLAHLHTYVENYPKYDSLITSLIKDNKGKQYLKLARKSFIKETKEEAKVISLFSLGSTLLFLITLGYVAYLLVSLDKKNLQLVKLARKLEETLETDDITGLPNRRAFNIDATKIKNPTFILVNIDGFKNINDFYGTIAGDFILNAFGKFLKRFLREYNFDEAKVYRLGADDFGILYENKRKETVPLVKKLLSRLENETFIYQNLELTLSVSVGITFEPPLLEKADMVLKQVKNQREKYLVYSKKYDKSIEILKNLNILDTIKKAIKEDKIIPVYQPIIDNKTGKIARYEVLARLETNDKRQLSPGVFLPVAKESKYYREITKIIMTKAFKTIREKKVNLSINLSIEDVLDEVVVSYFLELLKENSDIANHITVELLESESIQNYTEIQRFVDKIRLLGAKLAIDDFGSGYSNFSHVVNLKPDFIKIDGSLIKDIHENPYTQIIVSTIVDFSNKLGIQTIAEFVSSEEIFSIVKSMGIDYSQGFYIGKPVEYIESKQEIHNVNA